MKCDTRVFYFRCVFVGIFLRCAIFFTVNGKSKFICLRRRNCVSKTFVILLEIEWTINLHCILHNTHWPSEQKCIERHTNIVTLSLLLNNLKLCEWMRFLYEHTKSIQQTQFNPIDRFIRYHFVTMFTFSTMTHFFTVFHFSHTD